MLKATIVLFSSDPELFLLLRYIFEGEGYTSLLVSSLLEMEQTLSADRPDAIIVDCSGQTGDAMELCRRIKSRDVSKGIPIAGLVSPDMAHQFIKLLKAGVNDSFVRPLIPEQLLHFLHGINAGFHDVPEQGPATPETVLHHGDLVIDVEAQYATFRGRRLDLTPIGFRLLTHLLRYPNRVHSREDLAGIIWNKDEIFDRRTVDVHVGRLRKSLHLEPHLCPIRTIRSRGYMFNPAAIV
jgi:two-component system phosphate regulon response regulator PhoB